LFRAPKSVPALVLPGPIQRRIDATASAFLTPEGLPTVDFRVPPGVAALAAADSVSWRVCKNPVALFVGGATAVILELAEPRVRAGVWGHSGFRTDPVLRLRRTGLAAMVTVYAARPLAEAMIARVTRLHRQVSGRLENGQSYSASDPELLTWVQATACYGFVEAYRRFVRPLSAAERDQFYAEGEPAARLYGATDPPLSEAAWREQLTATLPRLQPSPVVFEFLDIMCQAPALPGIARPLQKLMVRAAVELTPPEVRARLGLGPPWGLAAWQTPIICAAAMAADRLPLLHAPPAQASVRMGLPPDWLYRP
jgi:uncharacterized protein (DUF2236 family)